MQRVKVFWSRGCLGKIILLGAAALGLLCVCAGIGSFLPKTQTAPVPIAQTQPTRTPLARPTTAPPPTGSESQDMEAARADFTNWITTTVCAPGDAANPQPAWCASITGASFLPPRLMVITKLTAADRDALRDMAQKFGAFAYNNAYKKYNLTHIQIVSDADGKTLAERKSIADKIEFPQ